MPGQRRAGHARTTTGRACPAPTGNMRSITATLLAGVLALSAQQAPVVETPTKGAAKFATSTQLVVEDLILKDKSGNAVTGLKASDLSMLEDAKPQKIEFLEFQNLE